MAKAWERESSATMGKREEKAKEVWEREEKGLRKLENDER